MGNNNCGGLCPATGENVTEDDKRIFESAPEAREHVSQEEGGKTKIKGDSGTSASSVTVEDTEALPAAARLSAASSVPADATFPSCAWDAASYHERLAWTKSEAARLKEQLARASPPRCRPRAASLEHISSLNLHGEDDQHKETELSLPQTRIRSATVPQNTASAPPVPVEYNAAVNSPQSLGQPGNISLGTAWEKQHGSKDTFHTNTTRAGVKSFLKKRGLMTEAQPVI